LKIQALPRTGRLEPSGWIYKRAEEDNAI